MASKQQLHWHLSFDIGPDLTIRRDGRPCHKATAIARRGDLAYMAELELVSWAEDIAAFFEQVRSVFFEAEVNGVPEFPAMGDPKPDKPPAESPPTPEPVEATLPVEKPTAEVDELPIAGEYDIEYYPADTDTADVVET